jgi:hypothetical protein
MTTSMLTPWADLLSHRFSDVSEEYGPNSHMVVSALEALDDTPWLEHVGEPLADSRVIVVQSWDDALTIFNRDRLYNVNGLLEAPCKSVDDVFERFPERDAWWQQAREEAKRYTLLGGIPRDRPREDRDRIFEHLYEFVSMLLAEIIASPEADCTYFREQLSWFHTGHFPCGWEGMWPSGRRRVY